VGVWAAQHREVQSTGDRQVVGVEGLAGEQGSVFAAQHPGADEGGGRGRRGGHALISTVEPFCSAAQVNTAFTMLW